MSAGARTFGAQGARKHAGCQRGQGTGARWHLPHCHCEERSDVAIRTPAAQHSRKQRLGQIRKSTTNLPKVVPVCQVSLRGCGLPRLVAQKSAMPCSGLWPEQGNAPLGLLSPQSGTLCGAPMHWFAMASINLPPVRGHKNRQGRLQNRRRPHCFPVVYLYSSTSFSRCS